MIATEYSFGRVRQRDTVIDGEVQPVDFIRKDCPCSADRQVEGTCSLCDGRGYRLLPVDMSDVFTPPIIAFLRSATFFRQHGVMPEPGGVNDQPSAWIEAVITLDDQIREHEQRVADNRSRALT